jgi:hypothetical protein
MNCFHVNQLKRPSDRLNVLLGQLPSACRVILCRIIVSVRMDASTCTLGDIAPDNMAYGSH